MNQQKSNRKLHHIGPSPLLASVNAHLRNQHRLVAYERKKHILVSNPNAKFNIEVIKTTSWEAQ